jgi:hypothetical protein
MSWGGNDSSSFWMNITRQWFMLSVQVQQGRQQKHDKVKDDKVMCDIVNAALQMRDIVILKCKISR